MLSLGGFIFILCVGFFFFIFSFVLIFFIQYYNNNYVCDPIVTQCSNKLQIIHNNRPTADIWDT